MLTRSFSFDLPISVLTIESFDRPLAPLLGGLRQRGYQVDYEQETQTDLATVLAAAPDLLLIDLRTSGSQGYELCRQLRQSPTLQDITVVMVGSAISKVQSVLALRSGASDYFNWPLQVDEYLLRIERQVQMSCCIRGLRSQNAGLTHELQQQASIQNALTQKNRQLEQLAYLDGLTGVANRLSFTQKLGELWTLMARNRQPLSLILCDVDHFKGYNDTYGHVEGDRCLQMIGDVLKQVARRRTDLVARYGGEEFAILLPATDAAGSQQVADQIQTQLAQRQWPHSTNSASPYVSMSIGVSSLYPRTTLSTDVLIRLADEALYAAKLQGRNRILTANSAYLQQAVANEYPQAGTAPQPIDAEVKMSGYQPVSKSAIASTIDSAIDSAAVMSF
ncbi:MAG: diguanylate cyclase [Cyanobacteria bacterium J06648_16]